MAVYHITYTPQAAEVCLYFDGECNFSCHGCIRKFYPQDCHLDEPPKQTRNKSLSKEEVIAYLKPLFLKRAIFLGQEPTVDADFLPLARALKERFSIYNILVTNGYKYVNDKVIDEACVSIKAISKKIFKDFTGRNNPERVLKNFKKYVSRPGLKVRAESIFIPDYINRDEIEKIAGFIAGIDSSIPYRIDAYIPSNSYFSDKVDSFRRPLEEEMKQAKISAERYLKNVSILHQGVKVKHRVERIY